MGPELSRPVAITHAGDDRLFVTLQGGRVVILERGLLRSEPFLDIEDRVSCCGEQGLLSVAFHPLYSQNGFFFADYTGAGGETVISRFSVSPADANRALATSEKVLLRIPQPFANHNGGQLQFGPDGYLYVGMGDGGSGFDPQCRAQDDSSLLGKLLRLDVDQSPDAPPYHGIPATNPFRGAGAPLDEIWAKGLRNPWRFSFDRQSGDLYLGDVGQNSQEEIDRQPAGSAGGENYGWKLLEGDLCLGSAAGC
ncbi:MAG TPA: PQQ-dependent sugar dehydrogenase, partial [Thermoanaerobaculia bacterium]|nr:PQQ-dependent sugar dehydrogenase [Thermoanaerobaculia bacterium]